MNIEKLKMLLTISDCKTLTRTAAETGYTQSGISNIMKSLERDVGFPLLHRLHRGVALTEEAQMLVPIVRELDNWNEQLHQVIAGIKGLEIGTVRVASMLSVSLSWLPKIFKRFQADYPNIAIKLREGGDREVLKWVDEGWADLAFCCDQPNMEYDWIPLLDDELVAVLPEGHPLAEQPTFPLTAFTNMPFIMMPEEYHQETKRVFDKFRITPDIQFSATDDNTTIAMVEEGLGMSMLSKIILTASTHRKVKFLKLDPPCPRVLGIALRLDHKRSPAAEKFIKVSKATIKSRPHCRSGIP